MAKIKITRPDGSPSPYFWSDSDDSPKEGKTIYKQDKERVTRMRGAHFDSVAKRVRTD